LISIHPAPIPASRQQNERGAGTHQIIGVSPVRVNPGRSTGPSSQNTERFPGSLLFSKHPPQMSCNFGWENAFLPLVIGLLVVQVQDTGGKSEYAVSVPARKVASPDRRCSPSARCSTSVIGRFQEASDWPSTKGRFHEAALLSTKLPTGKSPREVVEESSCQLAPLRVL
jgi:hypothetical protein